MEEEAVPIGREHEGDIEDCGVGQPLLHASPEGVVVVLCLDDGDREVGFVEEEIVGPFLLASGHHLSPHDDPTIGEGVFPSPLVVLPAGLCQGRADVAIADI